VHGEGPGKGLDRRKQPLLEAGRDERRRVLNGLALVPEALGTQLRVFAQELRQA
jgi:hypothetical protein